MRYKNENDNRYRVNFMIATEKLMDKLTVKEFISYLEENAEVEDEYEDEIYQYIDGKTVKCKAYDLTEENSKLHKEFLVTEDGRLFYWRTLMDKIELIDEEESIPATIIQFPQIQSNAFMNLTRLISQTSDNETVAGYAELLAVCEKEGYLNPGEVEKLQEQIREKRLENENPARAPKKPGLYCYTPEMGEQKPKCQIEAERSYYGRHYHIDTPLELKGRGITFDRVLEAKNLTASARYRVGWREYTVTERAFKKLQEQYTISQEVLLD